MARDSGQKHPRRKAPAGRQLASILRDIRAHTRRPAFQRYFRDLLIELCQIDTTARADTRQMQVAEEGCFGIIERELQALDFAGSVHQRRPIDPAIETHPNYSLLHFTKTAERPEGLSLEETYASRCNLVYTIPGAALKRAGQSIALNAHIDVVKPYFAPQSRGSSVYGRGACDDKGPVVSIIAALKVLSEVMARRKLKWNRHVLAMFVIEEETGGNGSLSLAIDRELKKRYESILVCECTGLKLHPANRGAVWYR